jgi:nitronate monooxygenase
MFPDMRVARLLGVDVPILLAPMAGGPGTARLAAAVSNRGGFGMLAGGMLPPEAIHEAVAETRRMSGRPFGVNLFVLETPTASAEIVARAMELLEPFRRELGMADEPAPTKYCEDFHAQFTAVIEARPAMASFAFGILNSEQMSVLHAAGILVCGTATTVAEARAWESVGADLVCAQGSEAGGHRGSFLGEFEASMIGTMALTRQIVEAVRVPVIAAGGIMDGRGIAAALALGAEGVQMGTAFMLCPEAGTSVPWREALRNATDGDTRVSRVYSGKPARGIVNDFMMRMREFESEIPAYPIQNALTVPIRRAATKANRAEFLSLWAGQGVGMCREMAAGELMGVLKRETAETLRNSKEAGPPIREG